MDSKSVLYLLTACSFFRKSKVGKSHYNVSSHVQTKPILAYTFANLTCFSIGVVCYLSWLNVFDTFFSFICWFTKLHLPPKKASGLQVINYLYFSLISYFLLEFKPCGLGSRIQDVGAFLYKAEIKIIYFVKLCLIVLIVYDYMVYPDPKSKINYQTFRVRVNHAVRHNQKTIILCYHTRHFTVIQNVRSRSLIQKWSSYKKYFFYASGSSLHHIFW